MTVWYDYRAIADQHAQRIIELEKRIKVQGEANGELWTAITDAISDLERGDNLMAISTLKRAIAR